jgi:hypothetical protein
LRSAVRSLRATPIVASVAALSLALGIGATTVIFSLTNSLLLRKLPVRDPNALVLVTDATVPGRARPYALGVWESFRRFVDVFDGTLAWSSTDFNLAPRGEAQIVSGAWVSGSYFETLGISPLLGRLLAESDDRRDGGVDGPVAVINHAFWQRQHGAAPDVIGRSLMLDGVSFTVVGVMPQRFSGLDVGRRADVIVPFGAATLMPGSDNLQVTIMGRRRADQTVEAATVALRRLQPQIREASLPQGPRWRQQDLDAYLRDAFVLLSGATGNSRLRLRYERPLGLLIAVVDQNQWVDAADSFTSAEEVDAAMAHGWRQRDVGERGWMCDGFVDLGLVNDPTVIVLGHPEGGLIFIDLLWTFEGSRAKPVQLADVEAAIKQLSQRFQVRRWRIESWQGVAATQSLQRLGLPVELFAPTARAHAEEWPILAQRLASRTIVLPKHERMREELLNLTVSLGPQGVRVIDKGRVHQDHAVAIRGVVAGLTTRRSSASGWCLTVGDNDPNPFARLPMASDGLRCL